MRFGYTIVYVADVPAALAFYRRAFGFETRFLHESEGYGELETGGTALAFAAHAVASGNLPGGYTPLADGAKPAGMEVGFVTDDVPAAFARAVAAGATPLSPPATKPWGQTVAYVRAPEGTLVEICTPVG
jgi:catechol 2,3-dioxygenase-like lactoylglutathione lyase family enzyme